MKISIQDTPIGKPSTFPKHLTDGWQTVDYTLQETVDHITSGKPLVVAHLQDGYRAKANFLRASAAFLDVDSSHTGAPLTDEELARLLASDTVRDMVAAVVPSFSDAPGAHKLRIIIQLDNEITSIDEYEAILRVLGETVSALTPGKVDSTCWDAARMFYGAKPGSQVYFMNPANRVSVPTLRHTIAAQRAQTSPPSATPATSPAQTASMASIPAPPTQQPQLPPAFIRAIEAVLRPEPGTDGFSRNLPSPVCHHEHDDTEPGANWHMEKYFLWCHKCKTHYSAKAVGAALNIYLADYLSPPANETQPMTIETTQETGKEKKVNKIIPHQTAPTLKYYPPLAQEVGDVASILLLQLDYWLHNSRRNVTTDPTGRRWLMLSCRTIMRQLKNSISYASIDRHLSKLKDKEFIDRIPPRKGIDEPFVQRIALNYERLAKLDYFEDQTATVNQLVLLGDVPLLKYYPPLAKELGHMPSILLLQLDFWFCTAQYLQHDTSGKIWLPMNGGDISRELEKTIHYVTINRHLNKLADLKLISILTVANANDDIRSRRKISINYDNIRNLKSVDVDDTFEVTATRPLEVEGHEKDIPDDENSTDTEVSDILPSIDHSELVSQDGEVKQNETTSMHPETLSMQNETTSMHPETLSMQNETLFETYRDTIRFKRNKENEEKQQDNQDTPPETKELAKTCHTEGGAARGVITLYEANIGPVSTMLALAIDQALNQYEERWVRDALILAVCAGGSWSTVQQTLITWQRQGYQLPENVTIYDLYQYHPLFPQVWQAVKNNKAADPPATENTEGVIPESAPSACVSPAVSDATPDAANAAVPDATADAANPAVSDAT
ncbi:MAG: hypothetical protein ACLFTK_01425, partial [Anaerolineales bacterium]